MKSFLVLCDCQICCVAVRDSGCLDSCGGAVGVMADGGGVTLNLMVLLLVLMPCRSGVILSLVAVRGGVILSLVAMRDGVTLHLKVLLLTLMSCRSGVILSLVAVRGGGHIESCGI